ncbi:MAG: helix-turn-helix domain-containing protein [Chitinophagales bacterium]
MVRFRYVVKNFEKFIDDWGRFLKVKPDNHLLVLPSSLGKGYFYARTFNEAMSFLVMNARFNDDITLERKPSNETSLLLYFLQVNVSGYCQVASDIDKVEYTGSIKRRTIFLSSTNYPLQVTYSKGTQLKLIGVYFRSSLVRKFLKKDIFHHLKEYSQVRLKDLDKKSFSNEEDDLLKEIFQTDLTNEFGKLVLYNRILLLVEKILNRFLLNELPLSKTKRLKEKDMDGLKEVEFILSEKELEKFPSIKDLSRIALMSSSKLKNRFKEVYGMKLYEFYNYNRLLKAKKWIEAGQTNVKEAAYRIGFSNLSNFSKAFKNEFGLLPSQVKA